MLDAADLAELDGVQVWAMALGYDGSQTDGTDWSLDRSDLPRLTTQIGALTINHVDELDYDQFIVNGIPVDPASITPVDFADDVVVATGNHEGSVKAWITIKANMIAAGWHAGKMSTTDALAAIAELGHPDPEAILAGYPAHAIKAAKAKASKDAAKAKKAGLTPPEPAEPPVPVPVPAPVPAPVDAAAAEQAAHKAAHQAEAAAAAKAADEAQAAQAKADALANDAAEAAAKAANKQAHDAAIAKQVADLEAKVAAAAAAKAGPAGDQGMVDAAVALVGQADEHVGKAIETGDVADHKMLLAASNEMVNAYLMDALSPDDYAKAKQMSPEAKRTTAIKVAAQHTNRLESLASIGVTMFKGPREVKRALARETGTRRPTGGTQDPSTHTVYSSQLDSMDRAKLEAVLIHHSGGTEDSGTLAHLTDAQLRAQAHYADNAYAGNVAKLQALGYSVAQIPHSQTSTSALLSGSGKSLDHQGPGPKPGSMPAHTPTATGATPSMPSTWGAMSQSAKSNWASKHGGTFGPSGAFIPHPAEWLGWSGAKKAGWTKKVNNGSIKGSIVGHSGVTGSQPTKEAALPAGSTKVERKHILSVTTGNVMRQLPVGSHTVSVETYLGTHEQLNNVLSPQHESESVKAAQIAAYKKMTAEQRAAIQDYSGSAYTPMNNCAKGRGGCEGTTGLLVARMTAAFEHAAPAPKNLIRGKHQSKGSHLPKELNYQVGQVYNEPGFGSWSTRGSTAGNSLFGNYTGNVSVMTRLVNSHGVPGVRANAGEYETALTRDVKYKILAIHDVVGTNYGSPIHQRTIDVEVVGWKHPVSGKTVYIDADGNQTMTKPEGATFVARSTTLTAMGPMTMIRRAFRRAGTAELAVDPPKPAIPDGVPRDDLGLPLSAPGERWPGETDAEFRDRYDLDGEGRYGGDMELVSEGPAPDSIVFLADDDPAGDADFDEGELAD